MQTIRVRTAQNVFIHYPLASIGDRIAAYLIDSCFLILYFVGVIALLWRINIGNDWTFILLLIIPYLFYRVAFEIFMNGQTPGKRLLNIQVIRMDGGPATIGNYLMRWLLSLIEFNIFNGLIAFITILANGKGQRLGDLAAGTTVIKRIPYESISISNASITVDDNYVLVFPEVINLTDSEIELVRRALDANRDHANPKPAEVITEKIKAHLQIQSDMPPIKFLYTILKDHSHLNSSL